MSIIYKDKDYFLYYQNLIQCIKNILAIPDITQNYALSYENFEYNGESIYGEQNTGKWQYPIWHRNKQNAKQLLGYLPILEAANRDLFYPRVSTIIADWPEAASFCLVYKSSNSSLPCHSCLIKRDNLANIDLSVNDVILRTHDEMRKYFENDTQKSVCIESVYNFFLNLPNINIYLATVPDRMHHLDLGLFHYQIIFTCDILKLQHVNSNKLVEEVDRRLAAIPRFPAIKIFSNGLQSIARLTANEYRSLIKAIIFVINNLYDENNNEVDNFVNNDDFAKFNKKDVEPQLLRTIKRQAISIRMSQHSVNPAKTPRTCKFSARLFEFSLQDANTFFNEKKNSVDNKMQTSFARFIGYLDSYLDLLDGFTIIGKTQINIYGSVTLENGAIMRDTNRYHNKVWFSDIAISMDSEESNDYISDKGLCYGQVLLLAEVLTDQPLNLALIQWYDFKSKRNPYLYGCPHLKLIELYNFVAIESIHGIIHIVPRFDKQNEYFVNKYIF
ncbi:hypothetical protein GLOIN_2v1879550 [Rhizophagus irregularis DAOM 181602=DAOM 197198]|nr:hypothetical protein GLOIN_2v1879550 [Rhizophagus irregularis DAOM 181602=DAOM 197198]